jgi:hypothetical protein
MPDRPGADAWLAAEAAAAGLASGALLRWASTLRVAALLLSIASFGLLRYLRPRVVAGRESPASSWPGQSR